MISKCICIKDYYVSLDSNYPIYKNGEYYEYTDKMFVTRNYPAGYNVKFSKGEYLFFRLKGLTKYGDFGAHFKTLKDIRKDKLNKINVNKEKI